MVHTRYRCKTNVLSNQKDNNLLLSRCYGYAKLIISHFLHNNLMSCDAAWFIIITIDGVSAAVLYQLHVCCFWIACLFWYLLKHATSDTSAELFEGLSWSSNQLYCVNASYFCKLSTMSSHTNHEEPLSQHMYVLLPWVPRFYFTFMRKHFLIHMKICYFWQTKQPIRKVH